jgi:hypothetical protein
MVGGLRREFEARCAALEPGGDARVEWRSAGVLCAPQLPPCAPPEEPPLLDGAAGSTPHDAPERREAQPDGAGGDEAAVEAGVEARRRALEEELAWAQAALAARREQLRDGRGER